MTHRDLVIIGSGMAAARLVATLRRQGDRRSIVLLGAERALPYNRIMLSPLLAGEAEWQQLITHQADWYVEQQIDLHLGYAVVEVDVQARRVRCADGFEVSYGDLVFATGSRAALPPIAGVDLPGVSGFRDHADVTRLQQATRRGGNAVVLGGGLLGLEAAVALAARGMAVTLVHRAKQLMNRQLDTVAAQYLEKAIAARGVTVCTGRTPRAILGSCRPTAVVLEGGSHLPADLVVLATGIQPVTEIAASAGLEVQRGIVVDTRLRASAPNTHALGECCELNGETVGLVAPIWEQVDVLAANLCGEVKEFASKPYVTMLKVSGIDVHTMGEQDVTDGSRMLTYQDRQHGIYKKLIVRDSIIVGAVLYGDIADSQLFFNLIQDQTEIGSDYCRLLLAGEMTAAPVLARA
jgi:nitrite reductase (NADH) large subunit